MLKQAMGGRKERSVSLIVGNPSFGRLLAALIEQWGCCLAAAESARLVLVEEGRRAPAGDLPAHKLPPLPLSLEELWSFLENYFEKDPRRHIRISQPFAVSVRCRGRISETSLVSLSDRGARFGYGRELAVGEDLELCMSVESRELTLGARVIYVIHSGELDGSGRVEIGVAFERAGPEERRTLRNYIYGTYLERASFGLSPEAFAEGLSFLQLPQALFDRMAAATEPVAARTG